MSQEQQLKPFRADQLAEIRRSVEPGQLSQWSPAQLGRTIRALLDHIDALNCAHPDPEHGLQTHNGEPAQCNAWTEGIECGQYPGHAGHHDRAADCGPRCIDREDGHVTIHAAGCSRFGAGIDADDEMPTTCPRCGAGIARWMHAKPELRQPIYACGRIYVHDEIVGTCGGALAREDGLGPHDDRMDACDPSGNGCSTDASTAATSDAPTGRWPRPAPSASAAPSASDAVAGTRDGADTPPITSTATPAGTGKPTPACPSTCAPPSEERLAVESSGDDHA